MTERIKKSDTIWIGREAYMFLRREERRQRGCKELSPEGEERVWTRASRYGKDGKVRVDNDTFGGGDGTYWGTWWSWSVNTVKEMLDEARLPYELGETIEYISISL